MAKLTPWFPGNVKPRHVGVYNTKSDWCTWDHEGAYQYWDGRKWRCTDATVDGAYRDRNFGTNYKQPEWRGLAEPPKPRRAAAQEAADHASAQVDAEGDA